MCALSINSGIIHRIWSHVRTWNTVDLLRCWWLFWISCHVQYVWGVWRQGVLLLTVVSMQHCTHNTVIHIIDILYCTVYWVTVTLASLMHSTDNVPKVQYMMKETLQLLCFVFAHIFKLMLKSYKSLRSWFCSIFHFVA